MDASELLDTARSALGAASPRSTSTRWPVTTSPEPCSSCSACAARLDAGEARVLARRDARAVLAALGRQDRRGVAGVEAAGPDPGGPPAAAPRPGAAHPARRRGGLGRRRDRPGPRHHPARVPAPPAPPRPSTPTATSGSSTSPATTASSSFKAGLRPLGAGRRPRRRRTGRRRRPRRPRGPPLAELRGHVVRARSPSTRSPATIVDTTLRLIERELFDADWAEAKARLDRDPTDPRPRPHPRPAPRRRPRRDGHPGPHRTRRRPPARTAVHRGRRARDAPRSDPRAVQPHRAHPRHRRPATSPRPTSSASCSTAPHGCSTSAPSAGSSRGALRRAIEIRDRTCFHPVLRRGPPAPRDRPHPRRRPRAAPPPRTTAARLRASTTAGRYHHPDSDPDPPPPGR